MILTLGIKKFDDDVFEIPYNSIEFQFLNKPAGGLWGSTFTPDDEYVSDWARFVFGECFNLPKYYHGIAYDLNPLARVLNIETLEDFIKLLKDAGCLSMLDYGSLFINDKRYIDWDAIVEHYDAVHFGREAVMSCRFIMDRKFQDGDDIFTVSDLYSYDCECWVICQPVAIDFDTVHEVTVNSKGELTVNKKYPSISREEVKRTIDLYKSLDPNRKKYYHDYIELLDGTKILREHSTIDQFIEWYTKDDRTISRKEFDRLITIIRDNKYADEDTKLICNHLLGNRKYFKKIRLGFDGSYRANRIWFNDNCGHLEVDIYDTQRDFPEVKSATKDMSAVDLLKWMYKHFDTIYLSAPSVCKTTSDIEDNVDRRRILNEYDEFYDDHIWSCTDDSRFE